MFSIYYGAFKAAHAMAYGAELSVSGTADLSRPMRARRAKVKEASRRGMGYTQQLLVCEASDGGQAQQHQNKERQRCSE